MNLVYGNHIRLKALPGGSVAAGGSFFDHSGTKDVRVEKILIQSDGVAGTENSHAFESSTSAKLAMVDNGCPVLRPWLEGCYKGTTGDSPAFMENQRGEDYVVAEGQKSFARQLNLGGDVSTAGLKNQGGQAWVLGIKTEGESWP